MPQKPFKIKIFQLGGRGEYPIIIQKLQLPPQYFDIANIHEKPTEAHRQVIYDKRYLYSGYILLGFSGLFSQVEEEEFRVNKKNWWMHDLKQLFQKVSMYNPDGNIPVLGICWGSQVLAYLSGENIYKNPKGPEVGLVPIKVTKDAIDDVLFREIKKGGKIRSITYDDGTIYSPLPNYSRIEEGVFFGYENHKYDIKALPKYGRFACVLLAEGDHTKIQAFKFHNFPIWGIQFHPEHNPKSIKGVIAWRKGEGQIPKDKRFPIDIVYDDGSRGTPEAVRILLNFGRICYSFYEETKK